ncbi:hypothetical protein [uncultured Tenacibaculum sp.]|uniref:hypothetical protein n=1 Tax=uncultured Tenacibaculum sp. TaxID=174713 RepID=UPI002606C7ED|nr:hypothetical protein [uncultured Tenacibaculum sp.]
MELLKFAIEWTKDEISSSKIFILFGILFMSASIGFWQLGKTEIAKAFIYPILIAGILLLMTGFGFYFSNKSRLSNIESNYSGNPSAFVESEIVKTEKIMNSYENIAFKIFPAIIAIAALLIISTDKAIWRAICITVIAFLTVLLVLDINANARIKNYHKELKQIKK